MSPKCNDVLAKSMMIGLVIIVDNLVICPVIVTNYERYVLTVNEAQIFKKLELSIVEGQSKSNNKNPS